MRFVRSAHYPTARPRRTPPSLHARRPLSMRHSCLPRRAALDTAMSARPSRVSPRLRPHPATHAAAFDGTIGYGFGHKIVPVNGSRVS